MELDRIGLNLSGNIYENLETVRSYSDKRGIENKQKSSFLLTWANKDSLCLDIQIYFYETAIAFLKISEVLAM